MENILGDIASDKDIQKFEEKYASEYNLNGKVSKQTQFEYAVVLARSAFNDDIRKAIALLEDLARVHPEGKREYIYYLALGNARLKNYADTLKYCKTFQEIEPNGQIQQIMEYAQNQYDKENYRGMAVAAGGAALVIGSLFSLGIALARK